jgi:hypothetical protein
VADLQWPGAEEDHSCCCHVRGLGFAVNEQAREKKQQHTSFNLHTAQDPLLFFWKLLKYGSLFVY